MLARELRSPRRLGQHVRRALRWAAGRVRVLCDTGATTELESRYEVAQFADPRSLHARRPSAEPSAVQRLARGIWHACMWARRLNVRFATKYALLVTALSLPCYWSLDVYWEFRRQRLEWMVISAAAIMVPTVGGSLLVSAYRILGTCVGGLAAFLVYEVGRDCPVLTYTLLVLFSVPCFRIILHGNYPKIGQFALITFGVILINKWVANEDRDESVAGLAVRRTMSVALGVLAGMLVTLYVWPYEARVRVRQALSWWMLTALLLYDQLWRALWAAAAVPVSDAPAAGPQPSASGAAIGARPSVPADRWTALGTVRDYLDGEMQLQSALVEIRSLLSDTLNEPRLKGPFPLISYQRIINACQRLLDAMVAARWVMLPVPMAVVAQHLHPTASTSDTSDDGEEEESGTSIKIAAAGLESGRMNMPDGDGDDTASDEGASMLDLPIDLSSTVLMERGEQADMDGRLGQVIASAAAVSEDSAEYIRLRVERDLLRQSAAEREHRDALLSLTMYVLASALILKTPLPSVLPPIHAAQRRVADAMRDILVGNEPEISVGEADAAAQRAVDRIRYVFYYTQVMLGWEVVQELSIIGGMMRELYGSYGSFGDMSE
ncbi:hypothetical protein BX661DRAFT_178713 [Kickxella alabastrina]|uniref:uncharacterized protein n=1 Tax=Kickxella alabastrina TaxID=61397 RepID=UPI00222020DC|nr:uncharacterized protein BX661DRAFT_178713 [Kickxella alabastrina]KAI7832882.1 hypothetical protein BX661DRAFT_178713 [Kickxella alabastrina]